MLGSNDPLEKDQVVSCMLGPPGDIHRKVKTRVRVINTFEEEYKNDGLPPKVLKNKVYVQRLKGDPHIQSVRREDIHW